MSDTEKENKKKLPARKNGFTDDGRTIANMNVEGFRWHIPEKSKRRKKELAELNITKEERRAMIKGALLAILPIAFAYIGIFLAIMIFLYFWLN